jgi:hypothetical protein
MPSPVTLQELHNMHRMAAALVVADPVYLPIFERVEAELAATRNHEDAISRARAIAARQRAAA